MNPTTADAGTGSEMISLTVVVSSPDAGNVIDMASYQPFSQAGVSGSLDQVVISGSYP